MDISIHRVKYIEVQDVEHFKKDKHSREFYARRINIITKDGEQHTFILFDDEMEHLEVN